MPETDRTDEYPIEPAPIRDADSGVPAWRFKLAVLRHHARVYRLAYALLGDRQEAEDVTQEAYLRFWERGRDVRGDREWLLKVARNACLDRLRRRRPIVDAEPESFEQAHEEGDPAWHLQRRELSERLHALVAALPEPQRSLVVLFDMQGLSGAACARILGLNANQVKVYLHRARRRLRREMENAP